MTITEILWYALAITTTLILLLLIGVLAVIIPMSVERQRRRDETVDRDFEARRAQFPSGALDAAVADDLTRGMISPETVQRFIDRGWLEAKK